MAKVYRTLQLKVIERDLLAHSGSILPIHELISSVHQRTPAVAGRHVANLDDVRPGTTCSFIDRVTTAHAPCPGAIFRFGSYRKGDLPMGMRNDFAGATVDLAEAQLTDIETGDIREPVTSFNVLAYGYILIIESVRGAGGMRALETCLTELIRRHVDPNHPRIHLIDVGTREISSAIDRAGGVQEVIMDLVSSRDEPTHRFGPMLKDARSKVGGTDLMRLTYRSSKEGELTKADVLSAYADLDANEVDRLVLVLKDGARFVGTEKCKVRKMVPFEDNPSDEQVLRAMADYLLELQELHDGVSVITTDGRVA